MMHRFRVDRAGLVLALIVLAGLVLRVVGADWGLPLALHPDEWVIVEGAIDMASRNSFEPSFFQRPDHVEMKLSYAAFVAYAQLVHGSPAEAVFALDHTPFYVISRLITAVIGTATIMLAYLIGRRFDQPVGLIAAFAFAFFPPLVTNAHYATPDVPLTCAVLLVVLASLRYIERPGIPNVFLGAAAVALATGIKYPGAVAASAVALAVLVVAVRTRQWRRAIGHGVLASVAFVAALFVVSPVLFTNVTAVVRAITLETTSTATGADGLNFGQHLWYYTGTFMTHGGYILTAFFVLGLVSLLRQRDVRLAPLAVGLVFWAALSVLALHWARWALPMYVTPLLVAPIGVYRSWRWLARQDALRWSKPFLGAVCAVAVTNLLAGAVASTSTFLMPDTRLAARPELAARGITRDNSLYEGYSPFLPGAPWELFDTVRIADGGPVVVDGAVRPRDQTPVVVEELRYIVFSSGMFGRFASDPRYEAQREFYRSVEQHLPVVFELVPTPHGDPVSNDLVNIGVSVGRMWTAWSGGKSGPHIVVRAFDPGASS